MPEDFEYDFDEEVEAQTEIALNRLNSGEYSAADVQAAIDRGEDANNPVYHGFKNALSQYNQQ